RTAVAAAPVVAAPNGSAPATPATPAPATADDFQPALPALDLEKSQFGLLGRWGKRAAALVLRYHAFHQQRVNEILARAIGDAASQVSALSSRIEHGRADARAGADRALSAVGALEARTRETAAAVHATRASLEQRLSEADARVARLLTEHEQTAERVRALAEAAGAWRPRVEQELRRTFEHAHGLDLRLDAVGGRLDAVGVRFEGLERGVATNAAALGAMQEAVAATQQAVSAAQEAAARSWREHDAAAARTREQAEAATRAACALETRLAQALQSTALQGEELDARLHELRGEIETLRVQAAGDGPGLRAAQARIEDLAARVAHVGYRFAVRPYMGVDPYGATGDLDQPMGYGAGTGRAASAAAPSFEDVFRGPESLIAERQRQYLPLLAGATKVVDLGCGRGEFLGLLAEAGIQAVGVEQDAALVERCRARKLQAVHGDAFAYLRTVGASTLDAVFSAQFIEHLPSEQLAELLALARSRLREGGLFIAETPNPESFEALKTFHVDLTHQRPIYPQVLLYLCQQEGFRSARIFYPVGGGFTQKSYETSGEYAVVATR
ncbi:MAG TPA: methyltransferase domain-containing protein, partial [Vicinamibacteria bacterium]